MLDVKDCLIVCVYYRREVGRSCKEIIGVRACCRGVALFSQGGWTW